MSEYVRWRGVLAQEDTMTGDGRTIARNGLTWAELPFPIRYVEEDIGGHDQAVVVGRADTVRREGKDIVGEGVIDISTERGARAAELIREELSRGISVDLDDVVSEIVIKDADGNEISPDEEDIGLDTVFEMHISSARIRAATLVAIPAFPNALLEITDDVVEDDTPALVASAIPTRPPLEWFADPQLTEPTGVTITPEGQVFGHLAVFDVCHIGIDGVCTTAPHSAAAYRYFRTGAVECADGTLVATGALTMDTGHAGPRLSAADATSHYDNTGVAIADVATGEDVHGIWFSGALRPGVTAEQIRTLRGSSLSGDWRMIAGNLELVAALAVNVPGFPVPRTGMLVASGAQRTLTAAGIVVPGHSREQRLAQLRKRLEREKLAGRVRHGV